MKNKLQNISTISGLLLFLLICVMMSENINSHLLGDISMILLIIHWFCESKIKQWDAYE